MLSNSSKVASAAKGNSSRGVAGVPAASHPQLPTVGPRDSRARVPDRAEPIPEPLARDLKQLAEQVRQTRLAEISLAALTQLMGRLHDAQEQIRSALRDYPRQAPVPGLCQALLCFAKSLDQALTGTAGRRDPRAAREPSRDKLPLTALDLADVRSFCLGVSALVNPGGRSPFPADQADEASTHLSSVCAKLISQALALGRTEDFGTGPLLDMVNLIRRLVAAGMLNAQHESQGASRDFCARVFAVFQIWAEKERKLDTPHDVGKCASVLEMMYDHDLGGVTDPDNAAALAKVLAWLLGKDALARIRTEGAAAALSGLANLVKRLLERDRLSAQDRKLDPIWRRLLAAVMGLDAARMIDRDGRPLCAFANLLRAMLEKNLPRQWGLAARSKDASAKEQAAWRKLQRQFAQAHAHVVAAMSAAAFKQVREAPTLSNLVSLLKADDKQRKSGWAHEAWPARASLVEAAGLLVAALSQLPLADLKDQKTVGGLFAGLGYLWQEGLVEDKPLMLACLLSVLAALPHTGRWAARHELSARPLLARLLMEDHIDMTRLSAVLDVLLGPPAQPWTRESFLEFARQKAVLPEVLPAPLALDEAPQEEDAPPPARRLVGESRLVQLQQPTDPQPATPKAPQGVSVSLRPLMGSGGARARAQARRRGAEWTDALPFSQSAQWAPQPSSVGERSPLAPPGDAHAADPDRSGTGRAPKAGKGNIGSTPNSTTTTATTATRTTVTGALAASTSIRASAASSLAAASALAAASNKSPAPAVKSRIEDPAQLRKEWFRLLTLPHADPSAALVRMARRHPECLALLDEEGCDMFWHLIMSGKAQSMDALIKLKGPYWQPALSDKLMKELIRRIVAGESSLLVFSVLPKLMPQLSEQQRRQLQFAAVTPPQNPPGFSMRSILQANEALPTQEAALINAIGEGDAARVGQLLEEGAHANFPAPARLQVLARLINAGHDEALERLLAHPAFGELLGETCPDQRSLLHVALDALDVAAGESPRKTAQRKQIFALLLQAPRLREAACLPDALGRDALMVAVEYDRHAEVADMLKHVQFGDALKKIWSTGSTALCFAASNKRVEMLKVLARNTAARPLHKVLWGGMLPIEHAIQHGSLEMARLLLEDKRAWRNVKAPFLKSVAARAAACGLWELVPEILEVPTFAGQAGNPGPEGLTLLMHAIRQNKHELFAQLLENESVAGSVPAICQLPVEIPPDTSDPLARMMLGTVSHRTLDVVMLAIEGGDPRFVNPLLALPGVQARLASDKVWKTALISLARLRNFPDILKRLTQV